MRTNKYNFFSLILLFSVLIFSCTPTTPLHPNFLKADSLMNAHPDSALKLLRGIPQSETLSQIERAEYTFLLIKALDKNKIYNINDSSLINNSISFYHNTTDKEKESIGYFYLGRLYKNNALEIEAAEAFLQSILIMPEKIKVTYLGAAYEELAYCYSKQEFYEEAINSYHLAYNHYKTIATPKENDIYNVLYGLSNTFILLEMNDSAFYYANKALTYAQSVNSKYLTYRSFIILTNILYIKGDYQSAYQTISQTSDYMPDDDKLIALYYCWKGLLNQEMGQTDSAYYYWKFSRSISQNIEYYFYDNMFQTAKQLGNWKEAVTIADSYITSCDSIQSCTRQEEMSNILSKHKLKQFILQHRRKNILLITYCITSLIISIIVIIWLIKHYKKQCGISQNNLIENQSVKTTTEIHQTNDGITNQLKCAKHSKISDRIQTIRNKSKHNIDTFESTEVSEWIINISRLIQKKRKDKQEWFKDEPHYNANTEIRLSKENRIELEKTIFFTFEDIISELEELCPALTNEDMIYCILMLIGYDSKVISSCMGITSSTFRMRKSRLRVKLGFDIFNQLFSEEQIN